MHIFIQNELSFSLFNTHSPFSLFPLWLNFHLQVFLSFFPFSLSIPAYFWPSFSLSFSFLWSILPSHSPPFLFISQSILNPVADPGISKPGGAVPQFVVLLGSGDCFDAPSHTFYLFYWKWKMRYIL